VSSDSTGSRARRTDVEQTAFDAIDAEIEWIARGLGARGMHYPALIGRASLERAGYPESFPHLLLSASRVGPQPTEWCLSPAVCYHAYEQFAGTTLIEPLTLTARGVCFRGEHVTAPGVRQIEFEMREIVFLGPAEWVQTHTRMAVERVTSLAARLGLRGVWYPAEDPFFLPAAAAGTGDPDSCASRSGKALMQKLLGVKEEYRCGGADGLALASVNRHGTFFGERFDIRSFDTAPAHSACVAIGLDRWCARVGRPVERRTAHVAEASAIA
jgi:hypothetical protein